MISKISKINEKLALFKEHARKESLKMFHDDAAYRAISYIEKKLALNDRMTISELEQAIRFIEEMLVSSENKNTVDFKNVLSNDFHYRTLDSFEDENSPESSKKRDHKEKLNILISKKAPLFRFLVEIHNTLLNYYELAKIHGEGHLPVSKVKYDSDLLGQSQIAQDIETTTKSATTSDNSTSVMDIRRGGTTFYGVKIETGENDVYARPTIENFAGDSIAVPGSKANKIFHFGGQVLQGIILDEFENTMELIDGDRHLTDGLKPTVIRGNINWSKKPETREIYATVKLKILACAFGDPIDTKKDLEYFAIRSDGTTLDKIDMDMLYQLDQTATKDQDDIVPICTFTAVLDLQRDEKTWEHYLKMTEFTVKINTEDMISRKDPKHQPQPSWDYNL